MRHSRLLRLIQFKQGDKQGGKADSLAIFAYEMQVGTRNEPDRAAGLPIAMAVPEGMVAIPASIQGTVIQLCAGEGDLVGEGEQVAVMESMKMEHVILAPTGGAVTSVNVGMGDTVFEGHPLFFLEPRQVATGRSGNAEQIDLTSVRPDVKEVHERQGLLQA